MATASQPRIIAPSSVGWADGKNGQTGIKKPEAKAPVNGAAQSEVPESADFLPQANETPMTRSIVNKPRARSKLGRIVRALLAKRELTAEELQLESEQKKRREMRKVLEADANAFQGRIITKLTQLGLCYRYRKSERDLLVSGVQMVQFEAIYMLPDAIYFKIDCIRLPRGISTPQLMDIAVLTDLSLACQKKVNGQWSEKCGAWYIVERSSGVLGIPRHVMFQDMLDRFPPSADGLSIPLGMTVNAKPVYKSLAGMYSLLIGGTIGSGKSNIMNVILCALIQRNQSNRLKLLLIDLKGGLEFNFYEGVPHLLCLNVTDEHGRQVAPKGICYENVDVPIVLRWLHGEGERRIDIVRKSGYKEVGSYNQHNRKNALPHIILVIDEWADVKLLKKVGSEAEELLINIAQRFRAVGIHVILCTQVPKAEVVSTRIKGVLPAKLAFSCPTNTSSMVIIDNASAKGLEPPGRCILQWGSETQIQTPYINDELIHEVVEAAKSGKFTPITTKRHDVTQLEVLEWALNENSGNLSQTKIFANFRPRGLTRAELDIWLHEWEGTEVVVSSSTYRVEPEAMGGKPRRLVAVDNQPAKPEEQTKAP